MRLFKSINLHILDSLTIYDDVNLFTSVPVNEVCKSEISSITTICWQNSLSCKLKQSWNCRKSKRVF
jgi:hypothetical protein